MYVCVHIYIFIHIYIYIYTHVYVTFLVWPALLPMKYLSDAACRYHVMSYLSNTIWYSAEIHIRVCIMHTYWVIWCKRSMYMHACIL